MKRLFFLAAAFVLLFAGITEGSSSGVGSSETLLSVVEKTPRAVAEQSGNIHEARDFGGRTLRVGAWWEWPIREMMMPNGPNDAPDRAVSSNYPVERMMWDNARRVEELFNVRFESVVVHFEDFLPALTESVLAGEPFADVVILGGRMQLEAIGTVIQPWNTGLRNSDIFGEQIYAAPATVDDRYVWSINPHRVNPEAFGLGVNLDIINAGGLPNPIHLYESGRWTWDAMIDIMRRATSDTTGDGIADQFGISGQPADIIMNLIAANDGIMVNRDFDYGFDHPYTIVALEFSEVIFRERLWYPEPGGIMDVGNWSRNFYSHADGVSALFPIVTWSIDNEPLDFNYGFVPFPTGPNNTSGNTNMNHIPQGISVPIGTEWDVADILIILEELFSWPGDEPGLLFESGQIEWMRESYLSEADVQRAVHAGVTGRADIGTSIYSRSNEGYHWVLGTFAHVFWNGEMSAIQAVEHFRRPQQEMLDEWLERYK